MCSTKCQMSMKTDPGNKRTFIEAFYFGYSKKRRAIFDNKYQYDRGLKIDLPNQENLLREAIDNYRLVNKDSSKYLFQLHYPTTAME